MTTTALRQCTHLTRGATRTYVEREVVDIERVCLDCAALAFAQNPIRYRSWQHIYLQVTEAREQRRG